MLSFKQYLQYLIEQIQWLDSTDSYNPGNGEFVIVLANSRGEQKYPFFEGQPTHGKLSHAIAHYHEFAESKVMKAINQTIEYLKIHIETKQPPEVVLLKIVGNKQNIYSKQGMDALDFISKNRDIKKCAILNLYDIINDKVKLNIETNPVEDHILNTFMKPIMDAYEEKLENEMDYAFDATSINPSTMPDFIKAVAKGKTIKMIARIAATSGQPRPIYVNFRDSSFISGGVASKTAATFHKLIKVSVTNWIENLHTLVDHQLSRFLVPGADGQYILNPFVDRFIRDLWDGGSECRKWEDKIRDATKSEV